MLDPDSKARLRRLLIYIDDDPTNAALVTDAANLAYVEEDFVLAGRLIENLSEPLPAALENLKGLIALAESRFVDAETIFERLRAQDDTPASRFHLAWSKARQEKYQDAIDLLDDAALAAAPRAPELKIHALHHLGLYDEALAEGERLAQQFPQNETLMGALATLALDAEKIDLARHYASRSGSSAEGRAALGILALGDHEIETSRVLFDEAIKAQPENPRAWVGRGLSLLIGGDAAAGAAAIDKGAELFGDHIGSWIAAGWAHFAKGDLKGARAKFERALAIDDTFSESQGALAVMEAVDGNIEEAKRRMEIALRLDRRCFGGALAKVLLLEQSGQTKAAQKLREMAMSFAVGANGRTLGEELALFSFKASRPRVAPKRLH